MTSLEMNLCRAIIKLITAMIDHEPVLKRPLKGVRYALVELSQGEADAASMGASSTVPQMSPALVTS